MHLIIEKIVHVDEAIFKDKERAHYISPKLSMGVVGELVALKA